MLKNRILLRCATCAIASPDAELISPMIATTLSRSISRSRLGRRRLRIDAVLGDQLDLATDDPARRVDFLDGERDAHHRILAERTEKAGARRQMAQPHRVGLAAHDCREPDGASARRQRQRHEPECDGNSTSVDP